MSKLAAWILALALLATIAFGIFSAWDKRNYECVAWEPRSTGKASSDQCIEWILKETPNP